MKLFSLFVLNFVFFNSAFATTLGEVQAAGAIANTLQGTAQMQPKNALDKAKQAVQQYEENQNTKLVNIQSADEQVTTPDNSVSSLDNPGDHSAKQEHSPDHPVNPPAMLAPPSDDLVDHSARQEPPSDHLVDHSTKQKNPSDHSATLNSYSKENLEKRLQDEEIRQDTQPVDYKRKFQIFYKRNCRPSQKNCHRGAVLTNIKSLIFDYAHKRGSFSNMEKTKK